MEQQLASQLILRRTAAAAIAIDNSSALAAVWVLRAGDICITVYMLCIILTWRDQLFTHVRLANRQGYTVVIQQLHPLA